MRRVSFVVSVAIVLFFIGAGVTIAYAGNTFVFGELRYDLPEIYNAGDYSDYLMATELPSTGDTRDFTTAWLGVFLHEYTPGVPWSGKFAQVGLETTRYGVRWFVYAEANVVCNRGVQYNANTCYGLYDDLVSIGNWTRMRLSRVGNNWYAVVYDIYGTSYTVAEIQYQSTRIFLARSDTEEGFYESTDPYITAKFYHYRPQFLNLSQSIWMDWAKSDGTGASYLRAYSPDPCPAHYGATPNLQGDERFWFAGTGGQICNWLLFPSEHIYLPLISR